jgi:hypothetical protein
MTYRSFRIALRCNRTGLLVAFQDERGEWRSSPSIWHAKRAIDMNIDMMAGEAFYVPGLRRGEEAPLRLTARDVL